MTKDEFKRLPIGPALSDVLLALNNAKAVSQNALLTHHATSYPVDALALSTAEPLVEMLNDGDLPYEAVVHILALAAFYVQSRYALGLIETMREMRECGA